MVTILPNRKAQRQRPTLVFRRWSVRISARIKAIPADVCRGFPQSIQPSATPASLHILPDSPLTLCSDTL
jgi:hypothetical protein